MRKNTYHCNVCGKTIVTEDVDEGTTPMSLLCRATHGCPGRMWSAMYQCDQDLPATFEWYKPTKLPKDRDVREHVKMGGLLIRPKTTADN